MADAIRVGLAGFGLGGRAFHAPFIAATPRLQLALVLQRHGDEAASLYPGVTVVRDFDALLDPSAEIDLVVIATPNSTHATLATRALRAGKHVIVDKPCATSSDEAHRLAETAERTGRMLAVYHNRRWDGDFLTVSALVDRGWFGELREFESRFDRYRPEVRTGLWKEQPSPGSGVLFDLGPHLIDQAVVLFGRPLALSAAIVTERAASRVDDHFEIALRYETFSVRLGAGMMMASPGPRFRVSGSLGTYIKRGTDPQEEALRAGARPGGPGWVAEPQDRWGTFEGALDGLHVDARVRTLPGSYSTFYDNVCDVIEERALLAVTPEQAIDTIRLIEIARESAARGGAEIDC